MAGEWQALQEKLDTLRLAIGRANGASYTDEAVRDDISGKIATLFPKGAPRVKKLLAQYEQTDEEIEHFRPVYFEACRRWETARRRETNRIAIDLQPIQKETVAKLLEGLELISIALCTEEDTRKEFARRAPGPAESPFLPNVVAEIGGIGSFADYNSPMTKWLRRMRSIGALDHGK